MKFRQQRTALFISVLLTAAVLFCSGDVFAADGEASAGTAWQNNKAAWKTWLKDKTPQGKIPGTTVTDAIARELDEELKPELNGKSLDELEREALNAIAGKIGLDIEGELAGKDISGLEIEYREYLDANARLLGFTLKPEDRNAIVQRMTRGIVREIVREGIAREIALRGFLKWADRYFPNGIKISRNRVPSYWYYQNNGVGATVSNETLKKFTSLAEILHAYPPDNPFSNGAGPDHFLKFVLELENKLNKKKWFDTDGDGVYLVVPAPPSGTAPPPAARAVTVDGKPAAGEKLTATSTGDLTGDFAWESADDSENFDPATATWTPITDGVGGDNNSELTIGDALVGKYIRAGRGDTWGEPVKIAASTVTIDGKPAAGEKLTATSTGDLTGDFAWESADDSENFDPATATWTPIASGVGGENNSELTIGADADLVGKRIRVKRGDSVSEPTEPVAPADGSNPLIQGIEGDRTYTDAGLTAVE